MKTHKHSFNTNFAPNSWSKILLLITLVGIIIIYIMFFKYCNNEPTIRRRNLHITNKFGSEGEQRLPGVIIIGVMKAGTRATINYLKRHPQVSIAKGEVNFFNQDSAYRKGLSFYRSLMPYVKKTNHEKVVVEKSPDYFEHIETPERMKKMNSSLKIVVIFKDPISRALSDYSRSQRAFLDYGININYISFEMLATPRLFFGHVWESFPPVRRSIYINDLKRWYQHFPKHQIHIVNGDNLIKDPYTEMHELESFMGLTRFYTPSHFVVNDERGFPCQKKPDGDLDCLQGGKGHVYTPLDARCKKILKNYYKPFNKQLYEITGKDFGWEEH